MPGAPDAVTTTVIGFSGTSIGVGRRHAGATAEVFWQGDRVTVLINATVATEDAEFWDNPGVNVKGIARAVYENISFWDGGGVLKGGGGSSITQQLVVHNGGTQPLQQVVLSATAPTDWKVTFSPSDTIHSLAPLFGTRSMSSMQEIAAKNAAAASGRNS